MNTVKIKIFDTETLVPFPNVSQTMEIEAMKHALTNGRYGEMVSSGEVKSTVINLDLVDAISTFSILIPALMKDRMAGATIKTLDLKTGMQLAYVYRNVYSPWYNEKMSEINKELIAMGFSNDTGEKTA